MNTFIDIIKNKPGLCRTIHVFCCNDCKKIIYSFAKYKRLAYIDAKNAGWESYNRDSIWYCPECMENYQNTIDNRAGSISA